MKHRLTTVLCILIIAAASFATVQSYHRYHAWHVTQTTKATATLQAEEHQNIVKQAIFNSQVKMLEDQCSRDKMAYDTLTPAQKSKVAAPQCDLNLAQ